MLHRPTYLTRCTINFGFAKWISSLKILRKLLDLNSRKISIWISNKKNAFAFCLSLLAPQLKGKQKKNEIMKKLVICWLLIHFIKLRKNLCIHNNKRSFACDHHKGHWLYTSCQKWFGQTTSWRKAKKPFFIFEIVFKMKTLKDFLTNK